MATAQMSRFLRRLTRGMAAETLGELSDRQLLERLLAAQDEAVFEALVRRHGPMVYPVCWRVLQQAEDTEDAFQATFLVLAQKLQTVRKRDSLASWLHGVAHRVALDAKAQATRRHRHQARAAANFHPGPPEEITWRDLRTVLDSELGRLPEKWRLPLILCYLEGRSQEEAAQQLGWSKSTLLRRLEKARAALGRRLTRRGVVWPAALSAVLLSDCVAPAALAPRLVGSTVEAVAFIAAGKAAPVAAVSAKAAALTEGVLKTMFTSKLKIATAALVLLSALAVGAGGLLYQTQAAEPQPPAKAEKPAAREGDKRQAGTALKPSGSQPALKADGPGKDEQPAAKAEEQAKELGVQFAKAVKAGKVEEVMKFVRVPFYTGHGEATSTGVEIPIIEKNEAALKARFEKDTGLPRFKRVVTEIATVVSYSDFRDSDVLDKADGLARERLASVVGKEGFVVHVGRPFVTRGGSTIFIYGPGPEISGPLVLFVRMKDGKPVVVGILHSNL
jgi:RNA polymerase sigma factor (sigma-70 family)